MDMTLPNIALIVAASQSLLLSVLIFQKHRSLFANRFLGALMLAYTVILLHILFQDIGLYRSVPILYVMAGVTLAAAQLQYLYTKYLLHQIQSLRRGDWFHFLPFIAAEIALIVAIVSGAIDLSDVMIADPTTTPLFFRMFNWILIAQGIVYMTAGFRMIVRYNRHVKDVASSVESVHMNWLRNITVAGMSAWFLFFVEDLLLTQGVNVSNFVLVSVVFAVYVYAMGFVGLMKSEIFASPDIKKTMRQITEIDEADDNASMKYEKSGLTEEAAERIVSQLLEIMNRQMPYTDPSLTLSHLAEMIAVTPHNLSEVINSRLKKNFYDFVNGYRIDQVKKDLIDPVKQQLKILTIAFDAGFNSKATFNTLFKEKTGMTPSEFRKRPFRE
jgi:AraC-like DNA-binding protein